jgi:hypothetical protein
MAKSKKRSSTKIDWRALESLLFSLVKQDLTSFAKAHRDESFYGFAFDCNARYGQILLCLNSVEALRQWAERYSIKAPNEDAFAEITRQMDKAMGRDPRPAPPKMSAKEFEKELRWSLGDWEYQGFNSKTFAKEWNKFEKAVRITCLDEVEDEKTFMTPTQDRFMRVACDVMIRVEASGALNALKRTAKFKTWVSDHDETESRSARRLAAARRNA